MTRTFPLTGYKIPCVVCGAPPFQRCRTLKTRRVTDTHMRRVQGERPGAEQATP